MAQTEIEKKQAAVARLQDRVIEERTKYRLAVTAADDAVVSARLDAETERLQAELDQLQQMNRDISKKSTINDLADAAAEGQADVVPSSATAPSGAPTTGEE